MSTSEKTIQTGYDYAKELYAAYGVDIDRAMEKAAQLKKPCIFAIGNAPTALFSLEALMETGKLHPALIIGVPVGFVNVVESKERIIEAAAAPYIVARGRKGGSNVAAAICNAMLYQIRR